jgi:hypothetical protein
MREASELNEMHNKELVKQPKSLRGSMNFLLQNPKAHRRAELSLRLIKHHAMKVYGEVEVERHAFLTSALDGGEQSPSRPKRSTRREMAPGTHRIRCWVGPRIVLEAKAKGKNAYLCWKSKSSRPACSLVTVLNEVPRLQ